MKTDSETAHTGCIEEIEVKKRSYKSTHMITKVERRMRMKRQDLNITFLKDPNWTSRNKSTISKIKIFGSGRINRRLISLKRFLKNSRPPPHMKPSDAS